jgi:hypothetical protein
MLRRFPAQRPSPGEAFWRSPEESLSYRSLAAPCSFTRTSDFRVPLRPSERRAKRAPGGSGPPDAKRGRGESRFTARFPLQRPDSSHTVGVFFRRAKLQRPIASGTLVASSSLFAWGVPLASAPRPPRSVPRGPRERRALRPIQGAFRRQTRAHLPPEPKRGRNCAAFT